MQQNTLALVEDTGQSGELVQAIPKFSTITGPGKSTQQIAMVVTPNRLASQSCVLP